MNMTVHHNFARKFNTRIEPSSARLLSVGNRIAQMFSVSKNRTLESRIDDCLCVRQVLFIHLRTNISTSCNIGGVHLCIVKRFVRHDHKMMAGKRSVTAVVPVIHIDDTPGTASDNPVITKEHSFKRTILNGSFLCRCQSGSKILTSEKNSAKLYWSKAVQHSKERIFSSDSLVSFRSPNKKFVAGY